MKAKNGALWPEAHFLGQQDGKMKQTGKGIGRAEGYQRRNTHTDSARPCLLPAEYGARSIRLGACHYRAQPLAAPIAPTSNHRLGGLRPALRGTSCRSPKWRGSKMLEGKLRADWPRQRTNPQNAPFASRPRSNKPGRSHAMHSALCTPHSIYDAGVCVAQ